MYTHRGRLIPAPSYWRPNLRRVPFSLLLLTGLFSLLSAWAICEGLSLRLFGIIRMPAFLQMQMLTPFGMTPAILGWVLVVIGTSALGVLFSAWIRLGWSLPLGTALGALLLGLPWLGSVFGIAILACFWLKPTRTWLSADDAGRTNAIDPNAIH